MINRPLRNLELRNQTLANTEHTKAQLERQDIRKPHHLCASIIGGSTYMQTLPSPLRLDFSYKYK